MSTYTILYIDVVSIHTTIQQKNDMQEMNSKCYARK